MAFSSAVASEIGDEKLKAQHLAVTLPNQPSLALTQSEQIKRDSTFITTILQRHDGNPFAYDEDYAQLGDTLIAAHSTAIILLDQKENHIRILQLYDTDKKAGCLNNFRITWLALQLAMALTPQAKLKIGFRTVDGFIEHISKLWLKDFRDLEKQDAAGISSMFSTLKIISLFRKTLIVYTGNSGFSLRDYLKAAAQGFDLASYNPGTGQGHYVHGGIHSTPISKFVHDIQHTNQQWVSKTDHGKGYQNFCQNPEHLQKYRYYAGLWQQLAQEGYKILEDATVQLTNKERSQLEVILFLTLHETKGPIQEILKDLKKPTLVDIASIGINTWKKENWEHFTLPDDKNEFYKALFLRNMIQHYPGYEFLRIDSIKPDPQTTDKVHLTYILRNKANAKDGQKIETYFAGISHYETIKTFYRDVAHTLISKGLWKPASTKLGTTYKMSEVRTVLQEAFDWYTKALSRKGKLHRFFMDVKLPEKPEIKRK